MACRYQELFVLAAAHEAAQYAQVDALLNECNSQFSSVRLTGAARMTIAKQIKKAALPSPLPLVRHSAQA